MSLVLAVIPARFASTRFPGKVLAPLGDGTMLQEVWRRVSACESVDCLFVATDDDRVRLSAESHGAEVTMTAATHPSGTDRIAEVVERLAAEGTHPDIVLNVQADEPLVTPESLDKLVRSLEASGADMATLAEPIRSVEDLRNPNVVKLVKDSSDRALYFSRSPIPYDRATEMQVPGEAAPEALDLSGYWKHQGIYAFRLEAFRKMVAWPPSALECREGLEQLRALENGLSIQVVESDFEAIGVDTPEDLQKVQKLMLEAH